ncbi:hypothetical protein BN7874_111 [Phage NCTB]|nr:hypothetical protein BN7874_111 [Phage NCTB]
MTTERIVSYFETLKRNPRSYEHIRKRLNLTCQELNTLFVDSIPEAKQLEESCATSYVKYGVYPTPSSTITLKVLAHDADLPAFILAIAYKKFGMCDELLDYLDVPFIRLFDSVFTQQHFFKLFGIKKTDKFLRIYIGNRFNIMKAIEVYCKAEKISIDVREHYAKMAVITEKQFYEAHSPKAGRNRKSKSVQEFEDSDMESFLGEEHE